MTTVSGQELAERLLTAFAGSDLDTISALTTADVVVFGTDADVHWYDREALLRALDAMRGLGLSAHWHEPPRTGCAWAAGIAEYGFGDGATALVRVSFSFAAGRLTHAHFSLAVQDPGG